jgi:ketosteroid isomerase-like protein
VSATTQGTTSAEAAKALAVSWLEQVSRHDIDAMLATTTADWRMHGGPPGLVTGPDGIRSLFEHIGPVRQEWTVEDVIAEGDRVLVRATNRCEQESFFGLPAAGTVQVFTAMFLFRVVDGRVAEIWRNADDLGRYLQLGGVLAVQERG